MGGSLSNFFGAGSALTSCNPDYSIAQIGTQTQWTPIKNLTFSGDFVYTRLDQSFAGTVAFPGSPSIGKPGAVYELKDQNTYQLMLRAQRNW
ncbi:hypothetical protein ACVWW1_009071 [Bradyrhizobium sp. JR3.5]